ncbi:MAG: YDG domain-containing protein, partial [bacterium]
MQKKIETKNKILKTIFSFVFLLATFILVFFTLPPNQASADCTINKTLKLGSRGNDVKCLQTVLNVRVDGIFGRQTKAATVLFQKENNLAPDGIFGPRSRTTFTIVAASNPVSSSPPSAVINPPAVPPITTIPPPNPISVSRGTNKVTIPTSAIAGITTPAPDGLPTSSIADTLQYTATISWTDNPSVFTGNTAYTATITLTPKTGYTLTGIPANFFTVSGATTTNAADSGTITAVFPATALKQLTIADPASLTISKTYDGATTANVTVGTLNGKIGSEVVTVTGVATYDTNAVGTSKTITVVYTLGGANAGNYIKPINYTTTSGAVTAKPITVTADSSQTKVYGASDPTFTYTAPGLVGADTLSGALARASGETVNTYAITQGTLANANYSITFVPANFSITQKQLTISAPSLTTSKVYDGDTTAAVTAGSLVGKVGADTVTVSGVATYDTNAVGTGKTITVVYTLGGADQANYVKPVNYTTSTGEITPIVIVATAIAGVTPPVTGATPVTTVTAGTGYTGTVTWSGTPSTFASATIYTATITLTATAGYTLTGVTENQFT